MSAALRLTARFGPQQGQAKTRSRMTIAARCKSKGMHVMKKFLLAGASALMIAAPAVVQADEGMWLPSQTGAIADEMKAAGLELDPTTLGDLQRPPLTAIASLGGCSAAFLSPDGLVATNHHCVYGSVAANSPTCSAKRP